MEKGKSKNTAYLHTAIGFAICAIFWVLPPIDPITDVGMKCLSGFIAMIYLWSTIGPLWPSIFGLVIFGLSGIGSGGFNGVWLNAMGVDTVLLCLFAYVLFGAADQVGATKYIARWLLTRKIYVGRPIAFLAIFYLTCFVLSGLCSPVISLIMFWPIAVRIMEVLGIKREEKIWSYFFVGMLLVSALGQPLMPFKGAALVPISAFKKMTATAGTALSIPMLPYMAADIIMTVLVMAAFLLFIKIRRVDLSKIKSMNPSVVEKEFDLQAPNFQQKAFLLMIPIYLLAILLPGYLPGNPICDLFNSLGALGTTIVTCLVLIVIQWDGKPLLQWQAVAAKQLNWGILFMVAAGVYGAGTLSDSSTGITTWIVQMLNPLLGGQPEMVFVAILLTVALIITSFAHNGAMAVLLMPIVLSFSNQLGINPIPVAMGVILMVFCAILTPAASVPAGMAWSRRDLYSAKEIISIGLPMSAVTLLMYIFIGYPLIKVLIGA